VDLSGLSLNSSWKNKNLRIGPNSFWPRLSQPSRFGAFNLSPNKPALGRAVDLSMQNPVYDRQPHFAPELLHQKFATKTMPRWVVHNS
jgi:hypothetical protein